MIFTFLNVKIVIQYFLISSVKYLKCVFFKKKSSNHFFEIKAALPFKAVMSRT